MQIDKDDGVRPGTSMEVLAKLRPVFKEGGTTTAGKDAVPFNSINS